MSKDKLPKGILSKDILSEIAYNRPTENPQEATEAPQTTHDVGPLKKRHIRISDNDWQRLQDHFSRQGLNVSTGVRMIIRQYLERQAYGK